MQIKGITFSAPMVRALPYKSQTRRFRTFYDYKNVSDVEFTAEAMDAIAKEIRQRLFKEVKP